LKPNVNNNTHNNFFITFFFLFEGHNKPAYLIINQLILYMRVILHLGKRDFGGATIFKNVLKSKILFILFKDKDELFLLKTKQNYFEILKKF